MDLDTTRFGGITPKPHRHHWVTWTTSTNDAEPIIVQQIECSRCGKVKDEAASRRARNNRKRGLRIQRDRVTTLGGRNLAGNSPNLDGVGALFRYEHKSGAAFPERAWRWLKGIPLLAGQVGVLIVTDTPGAGHRARSVVVVDYDDWKALHQETTSE